MSDGAKFRLYTRLTLQTGVVAAAVITSIIGGGPWPAIGAGVCGMAGLAAVEAQPELAAWTGASFRRWALPLAGATFAVIWLTSAIIAASTADQATEMDARTTGVFAATLLLTSIVSFSRRRWCILVVTAVATGLAFGSTAESRLQLTTTTLLVGAFVISMTLLTLWGLRVVGDLERANQLGAELQLAEERLRFSRDLHDVVGRNFSAIAVKSELAVVLSRAGSADRATAEMDEVKTLAVDSMAEMRQLVRGYRDIDLTGEVAGARSLLSSMGCRLLVEGDPMRVPQQFHELAAWVVREGTTNILKHSTATSATLAFGPVGMSLRNNGATGSPREPSGLLGLAGRLETGGATLDTASFGGDFLLDIRWETA